MGSLMSLETHRGLFSSPFDARKKGKWPRWNELLPDISMFKFSVVSKTVLFFLHYKWCRILELSPNGFHIYKKIPVP